MTWLIILLAIWTFCALLAYTLGLATIRVDQPGSKIGKKDWKLMLAITIGGPASLGACIVTYMQARLNSRPVPPRGPTCKYCRNLVNLRDYWNAPEGMFCGLAHYEAWRKLQ